MQGHSGSMFSPMRVEHEEDTQKEIILDKSSNSINSQSEKEIVSESHLSDSMKVSSSVSSLDNELKQNMDERSQYVSKVYNYEMQLEVQGAITRRSTMS